MIPLLDPCHPLAVRPELPMYGNKAIIQIRVAIFHRPGEIMSPEGLSCLSREHYLAFLIINLSLVFCPILRHNLQDEFLILPRRKNSYARGWGRPGKRNRPTCRSHLAFNACATDTLAEKFPPHTPPPSSKIIFLAQNSIPRKFQKIWKYDPSFCGGRDNYLTNEGIGAIVH